MAILIDTYKIHSRLVKAGFQKEQADVIVETFSEAEEQVATKGDIELLRKDMEVWKKDVSLQIWVVGAAIIGVMSAFNFIG